MRPSIPGTKNRCSRPAAIKGTYRTISPPRLVQSSIGGTEGGVPLWLQPLSVLSCQRPSPINDPLHRTQARDGYLWDDDVLKIMQSPAIRVESPVPTFAALHRTPRAASSDVRNPPTGNLSLDYELWATCLRNCREIVATAALRGLAHNALDYQP